MEGTPNLPVSFAKWYLQKTLKSKFKHLYYIIMIMSFSFNLLDMYVLDITLFFFYYLYAGLNIAFDTQRYSKSS
jgi:hypothetical protein